MYKLVISSIAAFMLIGCTSEKSITYKSNMFQSVSQDEAVLVQKGADKNFCGRCGMDLAKYYKTSHSAIEGKTVYQYCSIHCLQDHLNDGVVLKNPQVVDIESLKFIDASKAYYVVGSEKSATMSMISKYAFSNKEDADKFKAEFGGEVTDFYKTLEIAKKDFKFKR